jgi:hypothetical protein
VTANTGNLVVVKGMSGLGNRMLSLLTASLYAVATKRRLLIDWRDSVFTDHRSDRAPDLFVDLFVSPLADPLPEHIEARSVAPAIWQGRLDETVAEVGRRHDPTFYKHFGSFRNTAISLRRADYAEDVLVFWSWRDVMRPVRPYLTLIDKRFGGMSNWAILREATARYLQPREHIRARVDQFVAERFSGRMLGLHIRATDRVAPVEKLIRTAMRTVRQQKCEGVFCATDNAEIEERVRRTMPNVVTLPKQLSRGTVPLHGIGDCRDRVERATQALVDMLLLSRCQFLTYASRSFFGYMATIYAPKGQVVTDVDRFNPNEIAKKIGQSWIY